MDKPSSPLCGRLLYCTAPYAQDHAWLASTKYELRYYHIIFF